MADYPDAITSLTNPESTDPMNNPSHADQHANANDEIEAIETELGVNPAGSSDTVAARLDALDTTGAGYFLNTTDSFTGTATFNDASNATVVEVDNDGTGFGLYIHQDETLADDKGALYVLGSAEQTNNDYLVQFTQNHASSVQGGFKVWNRGVGISELIENDGTNHGLYIKQDGVLASSKNALRVYSNVAQVNSSLLYVNQDHASSTYNVIEAGNDGTGTLLYLQQDGVLASGKNGLYLYSNAAQINSYLMKVVQDNASSTSTVLGIDNDGTGIGLLVQLDGDVTDAGLKVLNNGTGIGLFIDQNGNGTSLNIDSEATTADVFHITSAGTGRGLFIKQDGNGNLAVFNNSGTEKGLTINQIGVSGSDNNALWVYSNAAQTNASLVFFEQDNASSDQDVLAIQNDGTGAALSINQNGVGNGIQLTSAATSAQGMIILGTGAHTSGAYDLYVHNTTAQTTNTSYVARFGQDNESSTQGCVLIYNGGSGHGLSIDVDSGAHLRLTGDPTNGSPTDGDMWFDGTNMKIQIGTGTFLFDLTAA